MKTPFANFFKKIMPKENKHPENIINKPPEEIKEEKKVSIPKHEPKTYHRSPYFYNQHIAKQRKIRKIRSRIQHRSRVINRRAA